MKFTFSLILFVLSIGRVAIEASAAPLGWEQYQYRDIFSFSVPPNMRRVEIQGEDSIITELRGEKMTLSISYGMYTGMYTEENSNPMAQNVKARKIRIDGKLGKLVTWEYKPNPPETVPVDRRIVASIYFEKEDLNGQAGLAIHAYCADSEHQRTAITAFKTIRFSSKKDAKRH